MSLSPGAAGGGGNLASAGGLLGPVGQVLEGAALFDKMFGPKGAITQGDVGGIAAGVTALGGMLPGMAAAGLAGKEPTTMSKFNMLPEEFSQLPPEVRQEMLRRVMGR
jgi:hypothetical protein